MYLYTHTVWYSVSITHPPSLILHSLKVVWPCLAVIGGLDSGFYLGRECRAESKGEVVTATVVAIPDSEQRVEIQDQVTPTTAEVKKRCGSVGWGGGRMGRRGGRGKEGRRGGREEEERKKRRRMRVVLRRKR